MSSYPLTHLTPFHEFPIDSHGTANEALKWLIKDDSGDLKNSDCSREVSWYHSSDTKLFLVLHKQKKIGGTQIYSLFREFRENWNADLKTETAVCMYVFCMYAILYVCMYFQSTTLWCWFYFLCQGEDSQPDCTELGLTSM